MKRCATVLAVTLALVSPDVRGATPSRVLLVTARCPEAEMERLAGLLGAQLRPGGIQEVRWLRETEGPPTAGRPADEARLEVTCEAPALATAHLVARSPGTGRTERALSLVDVPEAERPRMLSLALAELMRTGPRHRAPLVPVEAPVLEAPAPATRSEVAGTRGGLFAGARVRQFFGPDTRLVGAEATFAWRALRLGASAGFASATTTQGRIDVRVVAGHAGLALLRTEGDRVAAEAGLLLEGGVARARGQAAAASPAVSAREVSRPHVAPGLFGGARLRLAGPAWLQVGLTAGHAWGLVANVDGAPAASTAGPWLGGSAAVRWSY